MKKIIYLLLFVAFPVEVLATTEKEYRFYYVEKEYSEEFYEKGKNNPEYSFLGSVWHYDSIEQISFEKPEIEEDICKETPIVKYQEYQKVRYIIVDQTYSDSKINLQEIEVFAKENKIEYKIQCSTCSSEFFTKIQNTKLDYEYNYIENNTTMILDLQKEYFPDDLIIKFHLGGVAGKKARFRVTVNNSNNINDGYYRYFVDEILRVYLESRKDLKTVEHEERLQKEILEKRGVTSVENSKIIEAKTEYSYKKRLYQYYREIKHYIDGYYKDLPGLVKDEANFLETETDQSLPQTTIQYIEKEVLVPTTITEYIEKKVLVPKIKIEKIPIITEKIKYQTKEIKVPVDRIVEKPIEQNTSPNYFLKYFIYLSAVWIAKKMSLFRG